MTTWQAVIDALTVRHRTFDRRISTILEQTRQREVKIYCREGCGNCCSLAVNSSFPEALKMTQQLNAEQKALVQKKALIVKSVARAAQDFKSFLRSFRQQVKGCPFLAPKNQSCTVYAHRPLSCRAMLSTRPSAWCGIDFAELHPLEKKLFVDSLDPQVVAFPTHYLAESQELGSYMEASVLTDMHDTFGINLGGNLIFLIWMELEYHLSELIEYHPEQAMALLRSENQVHPFVLQFNRC